MRKSPKNLFSCVEFNWFNNGGDHDKPTKMQSTFKETLFSPRDISSDSSFESSPRKCSEQTKNTALAGIKKPKENAP